ncbi:non-homologous end-joining DNA ligase [Conexibacter sp. DBS9H8]|uniref:non-homologous end-joining DNA ligase n=1 Tax=Conexibacter sp. DBS9H8 TaxID=2937801 RepID=UPI00200DE95D|nr:non-homologous end-joining DNA ligase [Conexibacter sp. DBS9H8]
MASEYTTIAVAGREVRLSNPSKVFFPDRGTTKLALVEYYLSVADAALGHLRDRPTTLKRYVDGAGGPPFFQKHIPDSAPDWLETVTVRFPSGRPGRLLVPADAAHLVWGVNLGVIDWNPWPATVAALGTPDELRIDLDPHDGADFAAVRATALLIGDLLSEHGLTGFPKTSGSRGIHITVPILPEQDAVGVRRAAVALAREAQRRAPDLATAAWWKEERGARVFVDYNQNAPDRTVASAYSVRPTADARVSTPVHWAEVPDLDPAAFTIDTVPERVAAHGDPSADRRSAAGSLARLLALAQHDEAAGLPDAPWPPNFPKMPGEAPRVAPSRARQSS